MSINISSLHIYINCPTNISQYIDFNIYINSNMYIKTNIILIIINLFLFLFLI